jgi:hypothetical protein
VSERIPRIVGFAYFGPNSDGTMWARGLIYECRVHNRHHCVEFRPVIGPPFRHDTQAALDSSPIIKDALIWERKSGETPETITLSPSIAQACCHAVIEDGRVLP